MKIISRFDVKVNDVCLNDDTNRKFQKVNKPTEKLAEKGGLKPDSMEDKQAYVVYVLTKAKSKLCHRPP